MLSAGGLRIGYERAHGRIHLVPKGIPLTPADRATISANLPARGSAAGPLFPHRTEGLLASKYVHNYV